MDLKNDQKTAIEIAKKAKCLITKGDERLASGLHLQSLFWYNKAINYFALASYGFGISEDEKKKLFQTAQPLQSLIAEVIAKIECELEEKQDDRTQLKSVILNGFIQQVEFKPNCEQQGTKLIKKANKYFLQATKAHEDNDYFLAAYAYQRAEDCFHECMASIINIGYILSEANKCRIRLELISEIIEHDEMGPRENSTACSTTAMVPDTELGDGQDAFIRTYTVTNSDAKNTIVLKNDNSSTSNTGPHENAPNTSNKSKSSNNAGGSKMYEQAFPYFEAKIVNRSQKQSFIFGWNDLVGMEKVTDFLKMKFSLPNQFPEFYKHSSILSSNFLLFGPPGTGKSMVGKVLAKEVDTNYISVIGSDIKGKWSGESEAKMKALFDVARNHTPIIIFLDECEELLETRENSKLGCGIIQEFLFQTDGSDPRVNNAGVYVVLATNLPWRLDLAIPRRVPNILPIKLPTLEAREMVLKYHFKKDATLNHDLSENDFAEIADETDGFSNAGLGQLIDKIRDYRMEQVFKASHFYISEKNMDSVPTADRNDKTVTQSQYTPVMEGEDITNAKEMSFSMVPSGCLELPLVTIRMVKNFIFKLQKDVDNSYVTGTRNVDVSNMSDEDANLILKDVAFSLTHKYAAYEKLFCPDVFAARANEQNTQWDSSTVLEMIVGCLTGRQALFTNSTDITAAYPLKCKLLDTFLHDEVKESAIFKAKMKEIDARTSVTKITASEFYKFFRNSCEKLLLIILSCSYCRKVFDSKINGYGTFGEIDLNVDSIESVAVVFMDRLTSPYSIPYIIDQSSHKTKHDMLTASTEFLNYKKGETLRFTLAKLLCLISCCKTCRDLFEKKFESHSKLTKNYTEGFIKKVVKNVASHI